MGGWSCGSRGTEVGGSGGDDGLYGQGVERKKL